MGFDCKKVLSKCKAKCCGPVPFPKKLYKKLRAKTQRKVIKTKEIYQRMGSSLGVMVIPFTLEMICPFLDGRHWCSIYEERPEMCRIFGKESIDAKLLRCPYLKENGEER